MGEPTDSLLPVAVQYEHLLRFLEDNLVHPTANNPLESWSPQSMRMNVGIRAVLHRLQRWEKEIQFSNEHQRVPAIDILQNLDYARSRCTDQLRMAFYMVANSFLQLKAMHDKPEDKFVIALNLVLSSKYFADALLQGIF